MARVAGRPGHPPEFEAPRPGDVSRLVADARKARSFLGWEARINLEEGLTRLVAWHGERRTDWAAALREDRIRNWEDARP